MGHFSWFWIHKWDRFVHWLPCFARIMFVNNFANKLVSVPKFVAEVVENFANMIWRLGNIIFEIGQIKRLIWTVWNNIFSFPRYMNLTAKTNHFMEITQSNINVQCIGNPFRQWLGACSAPNYFQSQCWFILSDSKKISMEISSAKWWPFFHSFNALTQCGLVTPYGDIHLGP